MPTLILTIFLLQLIIHLVNTIGASSINELVRFPSLSPPLSKHQVFNTTTQINII